MIVCPNCNGTPTMQVSLHISAPASLYRNLSKKNLSSKAVKVTGVSWETTDFLCGCGWSYLGYSQRIQRLVAENETLREQFKKAELLYEDVQKSKVSRGQRHGRKTNTKSKA